MISSILNVLVLFFSIYDSSGAGQISPEKELIELEKKVIELNEKTFAAKSACEEFDKKLNDALNVSNDQQWLASKVKIDKLLKVLAEYPGDSLDLGSALYRWHEYLSKKEVPLEEIKGPYVCQNLGLLRALNLFSKSKQMGVPTSAQEKQFTKSMEKILKILLDRNDSKMATMVVSAFLLRLIEGKFLLVSDALFVSIMKQNVEFEKSIGTFSVMNKTKQTELEKKEHRDHEFRENIYQRMELQSYLNRIWP